MSEEPHKSSVVEGKLVRCSVSQVKTFNPVKHGGCMRRWGFQKIWHVPEESGAGAIESTKCHTMAETYLKTGFLPAGNNNLERSLIAGKWMLPERGTDLLVEMPFDGEISLAGVPFNGKIDVVVPRNELPAALGRSVEVGDHKFHGDMERALSEDEMRNDPQMLGYGMVMIARYPEISHVRLTHYNYQKKEPRPACKRVSILMSVGEIQTRWASLNGLVGQMVHYAGAKDPGAIPANKNSCYAYGKKNACPHVGRCATIKEQTMDVLSAEEEAAFGGMSTPVATVIAPVASAPARPSLIMPTCGACGTDLNPENGSQRDGVWKHIGCKGAAPTLAPASVAILPPDAPKSDPAIAAACEPCKDEKNFQHKPENCPKAAEPTATEGGKRKRRTKAEMLATREPAPPSAPVPAQTVPAPTIADYVTVEVQNIPADQSPTLTSIASLTDAADRDTRNALARELVLALVAAYDPPSLDPDFVRSCFAVANAYVRECQT